MTYWELARPTYLENLPSGLLKLSMPTRFVRLTLEEAAALGSHITDWWEGFGLPFAARPLDGVAARLGRAMAKVKGPAWFVKLGSRSPKDSWSWAQAAGKAECAEQALGYLTDASERISDDLHLALCNNYRPALAARQWREMPPWSEFRVFIQDGSIAGISQYHHGRHYPGVAIHQPSIYGAIMDLHLAARDHYHLDQMVIDVFVEPTGPGDFKATLIEINPFCELTDPCLFDWREPFDGSFRIAGRRAA